MRPLLALIAVTALAQQPVQVGLSTPAPPGAQATAVVIGNPGNTTYTYSVIVNYPGGSVIGNAAVVNFAPATLTGTNYIQIGWNPLPGASSYDVVRTAGFSGSCTACAVAAGLTVNSAQDTGAVLSNYSAGAPAAQGSGTIYINTREYSPPQMRKTVNGVDTAVGSGNGNVTGVTATSPIVSSGGAAPVISCPTCGTGSGTVSSVTGTAPVQVATGTTTPVISVNGLAAITGAVKANGSGAVTQAACADLSNAGTGCTGTAPVNPNAAVICNGSASATAATCPGAPVPTTLANLSGTFIPGLTTTGAPFTLNIASLGAKTVYLNGAVTSASNVLTAGQPYQFYYDGTFIQASGGGGVPSVTVSTSSPVTVAATGFYFNNSSGAITFNLPTITSGTVGSQYCFRNYTGKSGAITLQLPASTFSDVGGANGSAAGTLVSSGALGDAACVVAVSTTQYMSYIGAGSWTNN